VRLRQFLDALPRLDGSASAPTTSKFHCRFKVADPISGYAWLDVTDPAAVLPQHEDMICAKLLRLDALPKPHPSRLRRKPVLAGSAATYGLKSLSGSGGRASAAAQQQQQQQSRGRSENPATQQQQQQQPLQPPQPSAAARNTSAGGAAPVRQHKSPLPAAPRSPAAAPPVPTADLLGDAHDETPSNGSRTGSPAHTAASDAPAAAAAVESADDLLNFVGGSDAAPTAGTRTPPVGVAWGSNGGAPRSPLPPGADLMGSHSAAGVSPARVASPARPVAAAAAAGAWASGGDIDDDVVTPVNTSANTSVVQEGNKAGKSAYVAACMEVSTVL
jgi:hypothetical protein